MTRQGRILIVDDSQDWRDLVGEILETGNFIVASADQISQAQAHLSNGLFHLVVLDIQMRMHDPSNTDGMQMLTLLYDSGLAEAIKVVMLSAHGTKAQMRVAFRDYDVADFLSKDEFDDEAFLHLVRDLVANKLKINLNLKIIWELFDSPQSAVVGTKFTGRRVVRGDPLAERATNELDDLLCRLFYRADQLAVRPLSGGHSGAGVLLATQYHSAGGGNAVIVKFGERQKIATEHANYETYVKANLNTARSTSIHELRYTPNLGGIVYGQLGTASEQLEDFGSFYRRASPEQICATLDELFFSTCRIWYANHGNVRLHVLSDEYSSTLGLDWNELDQAIDETLPQVTRQARLSFRALSSERSFANPRALLAERQLARATYVCTTHGDLHQRNLLIDTNGHAWLIDFYRTGPGHILRDVALLDAVVRVQLLAENEATLAERLQLEELLAGVERFGELGSLATRLPQHNPALAKAAQVSLHLRMIARSLVLQNISDDFSEYQIATAYQVLNMVRFPWLARVQREHALLCASLLAERLTR